MDSERCRWRTFGKRTIYDNEWVWLGQIDVEMSNGERFWHHVVRLPRAAVMVLVDDQDCVLMLWRHRFVQDRWGWELPGGLIDVGDEPQETAVRELEEETGYRAGRVEHLVTYQPMVGMVDSEHVLFIGRDPEKFTDLTFITIMELRPRRCDDLQLCSRGAQNLRTNRAFKVAVSARLRRPAPGASAVHCQVPGRRRPGGSRRIPGLRSR